MGRRFMAAIVTMYGVVSVNTAMADPPTHLEACNAYGPGARGICIAYCNQCTGDDGDRRNCEVLRAKFIERTGDNPPCDQLTATPTVTAAASPTATFTPIFTMTATSTPEGTATETPMPTATDTAIVIATATFTPISTATATSTPEGTATETATAIATDTPTPTITDTPTALATFTSTSAAEGIAVEPSFNSRIFEADLSGDNEVPSVTTDSEGTARLQLSSKKSELRYRLRVADIEGVTQAHIHCGAAGVNGPVVVFLFGPNPAGIDPRRRLASGTIGAGDIIAVPDSLECPGGVASFDALIAKIRTGMAYVNVHTLAHPAGEIRGTIEQK